MVNMSDRLIHVTHQLFNIWKNIIIIIIITIIIIMAYQRWRSRTRALECQEHLESEQVH